VQGRSRKSSFVVRQLGCYLHRVWVSGKHILCLSLSVAASLSIPYVSHGGSLLLLSFSACFHPFLRKGSS
jgi:hypothetical protein